MSKHTFREILETADVTNQLREVSGTDGKYLCYTGLSADNCNWLLSASNGEDIWRVELSESDVTKYSTAKGESEFLNDIKLSFSEGDMQVMKTYNDVTLCLKHSSEQYEFTLIELPAAHRRQEMNRLLFELSKRCISLESKLKDCQKALAESQKEKQEDRYADQLNFGVKTAKASTRPKKPAGHSLVNPGSKRRKAATGVVFGDQEDT